MNVVTISNAISAIKDILLIQTNCVLSAWTNALPAPPKPTALYVTPIVTTMVRSTSVSNVHLN